MQDVFHPDPCIIPWGTGENVQKCLAWTWTKLHFIYLLYVLFSDTIDLTIDFIDQFKMTFMPKLWSRGAFLLEDIQVSTVFPLFAIWVLEIQELLLR